MTKKAKKEDFDLYEELFGTDDMTSGDDNITDFIKDMGLEKNVTPDEFHSLSALSKTELYPAKVRSCTISNYHWCFMEALRRGGVFRMSTADTLRAVLSTGIVSVCRGHDVDRDIIDKVVEVNEGERVKKNFDLLDRALSNFDLNDRKDKKFLKNLVCKSQKSQYSGHVWGKIYSPFEDEKPKYNRNSIRLKGGVVDECKTITKDSLKLSKAAALKKNKDNQKVEASISWRLVLAMEELRVENYPSFKVSEMTRLCFISGLFIVAKWIIKRAFCKDEYSYCELMHNINRYIATNKDNKNRG